MANDALSYYRLANAILDSRGVDRVDFEPRPTLDPLITVKRTDNVLLVVWRPFGTSEPALCVVDGHDSEPVIVTFRPAGWCRRIKKYAGAMSDAVA